MRLTIMKLDPCPFCGSRTAPKTESVGYYDEFRVVCDPTRRGCGAKTYAYKSEEQAIAAWNRRAKE